MNERGKPGDRQRYCKKASDPLIQDELRLEKCEEGGYHAYMRENPGVQTEGETIQETMENFIDAFELFFRDELEGEIAKQSLDADRFEIEFALAQR